MQRNAEARHAYRLNAVPLISSNHRLCRFWLEDSFLNDTYTAASDLKEGQNSVYMRRNEPSFQNRDYAAPPLLPRYSSAQLQCHVVEILRLQ
jgi:hypothetical protein